jgi:hypothetical protein
MMSTLLTKYIESSIKTAISEATVVTEATNKLARIFMVDFADYMRPVDII